MLTRVTISGADDAVDPAALLALSVKYPFVEWGILLSETRAGTERYPSAGWRGRLDGRLGLSGHLCGAYARATLAGDFRHVEALPAAYARIQLNGWDGTDVAMLVDSQPAREIIVQAGNEELVASAAKLARSCRLAALWDVSGGRGVAPTMWPDTPERLHLGFAGKIGPDSVVDVLRDIGEREAPFWIDMESAIRTGDQVDLDKAEAVLARSAPFVHAGS